MSDIVEMMANAYFSIKDMKPKPLPNFYIINKQQFREGLDNGTITYKEGKHYFFDGKEVIVVNMERDTL